MRDEPLKTPALPPTSVAVAYAGDLERLERVGPLSHCDDAWLVLGMVLERIQTLTHADRMTVLPDAADALAVSAVAVGLDGESSVLRAARALRRIHGTPPVGSLDAVAIAELAIATQALAEEQELAGAFGTAYATLSALLSSFGADMMPRARGNVLAQLGRTARQFGASDLALDLYTEALQLGYESDALDVVARALLGMGVMALTRGNYPSAREHFERALANADLARDPELIRSAHHGLLNCAFTTGDLDAAMVHGWNVLRLCIAPDSRAEALLNMAEICRLTGEHDAALRTYAIAMEWTSQSRVRAHAMSGALQSAILGQRHSDAQRYLAELETVLPTLTDPYTRATLTIEVADSLHRLGDQPAACARLEAARAIAEQHAFHELLHRAEQAATVWNAPPPLQTADTVSRAGRRTRPYRSEHFRLVLRSLNGLTTAASK
jgi:tetratricopeptide (TPR) repeat protein